MTPQATKADNDVVQKLLDERHQIETWLDRLDESTGKVSGEVRDRVQSDYQARLDRVVDELRGHAESVQSSLAETEGKRDKILNRQSEAQERHAEAKLRHDVGEYDDATWAKMNAELEGELAGFREQLVGLEAEIAKYEEVLRLIERREQDTSSEPVAPPPPPPQPAPEPAAASKAEAPAVAKVPDKAPASPEPAPATQAAPRDGPSQTDAFDELAFLKSVTQDSGEAPPRTSRPSAPAVPPQPRAASPEARPSDAGDEGRPSSPFRASAASGQRTLKCTECNWMNLPTEWYCERCGAELAAL